MGVIAERASGLSYDQLLQRYVYKPLALSETSLPEAIDMPKPYLHGYDLKPNKPRDDVCELIYPAGAWASRGIVSTPADVARFFRATSARGSSATTSAAWSALSSPGVLAAGPGAIDAGLGFFRDGPARRGVRT